MKRLYQDAMSIVRRYGQPSYFITMTCNPEWPEITRELIPNVQRPQDRPDLIARVFNIKLKALIHDVMTRELLGNVIARVHTIEFQKRGLSHAHLLLITAGEDRPRTADDIDAVVSAELPDPEEDQPLWKMEHRHQGYVAWALWQECPVLPSRVRSVRQEVPSAL